MGTTTIYTGWIESGFSLAQHATLDPTGYFKGEAGIRYTAQGEHGYELRSEFGSADLVHSAARALYDAAIRAEVLPRSIQQDSWNGFLRCSFEDIELSSSGLMIRGTVVVHDHEVR